MIAKEWRDVRWKFAVGVLLFLALVVTNIQPYETVEDGFANAGLIDDGPKERRYTQEEVVNAAIDGMFITYDAGKGILAPLAAILGVGLISSESSRDTIFLLLSKPISRIRLLLTKYGVGAGVLFVVALLGSAGLLMSAAARGYPLGSLSMSGIALSTLLLWLGSLVVLGVALLTSVVFRSVIGSVVATVLALYLVFNLSGVLDVLLYNFQDVLGIYDSQGRSLYFPYGPIEALNLAQYWTDQSLYFGESLAAMNFLVCLIAAALPLLAAMWLFNRKAY